MARARPRPRAPFVVTVVLTAAAGACGGGWSVIDEPCLVDAGAD